MIDDLAKLLSERFQGREGHYAAQLANGQYRRVARPLTEAVCKAHIQKALTVGSYVLREDNTCNFAALDFDEPGYSTRDAMDFAVVTASRILTHYGLDHVLERSGKKGTHLWVFFTIPIQAVLVREFLTALHAQLEAETEMTCPVELFPKQDALEVDRDGEIGYGNLIKLPWGVHRMTGNRCMLMSSALEFYKTLEEQKLAMEACKPLSEGEIMAFVADYPPPEKNLPFRKMPIIGKRSDVFGTGFVPCTSYLEDRIIYESTPPPEKGRNQRIYDLAVRYYRGGMKQDKAYEKLRTHNQARCSPPLDESEVRGILMSVYRNGYSNLRCEALHAVCQGKQCPIYCAQHNITPEKAEEEIKEVSPEAPIQDLVKIKTEPCIWRMTVEGKPVQIEGADFMKFSRFDEIYFQTFNRWYNIPKLPKETPQKAWVRFLSPILEGCQEEDAPEEASEQGRLRNVILDWAVRSVRRNALPENLKLSGWVILHSGYPGYVLFRMESLKEYLERKRIGSYRPNELWVALRALRAKEQVIRIDKEQTIRAILLPVDLPEEAEEETKEASEA